MSDSNISAEIKKSFEQIKLRSEEHGEYWSGRDLMVALGYGDNWDNFEKVINYHNGLQNVLSTEGIEIYQNIENKYFEILEKHKETIQFIYINQPYNFTYSKFLKLNP